VIFIFIHHRQAHALAGWLRSHGVHVKVAYVDGAGEPCYDKMNSQTDSEFGSRISKKGQDIFWLITIEVAILLQMWLRVHDRGLAGVGLCAY